MTSDTSLGLQAKIVTKADNWLLLNEDTKDKTENFVVQRIWLLHTHLLPFPVFRCNIPNISLYRVRNIKYVLLELSTSR